MSQFVNPSGRGTAMKAILLKNPLGGDIIGQKIKTLNEVRPDLVLSIANYNSPTQVSIISMGP